MEEFENKNASAPERAQTDGAAPERAAEGGGMQSLYEWVRSLASAILLLVLVFTFAARVMDVQGPSMRSTLEEGDRLLVVNATLVREYRQGDVVVARRQTFSDEPIVKRVIAVAGQTVDIDFAEGTVYVDGEELEEDYINERTYTWEGVTFPLTVEEGCLFLMGDNRNMSTDSRDTRIGQVDERELIGRAVLILFPGPDAVTEQRDFSRIGTLKG